MGEGNKKLSKRDPESNLFLHRERGFIPEGLLNYLSLLGWGLSADRDVFTRGRARRGVRRRERQPQPRALRPQEGRGHQRHSTCGCSRPRTSATAWCPTCTPPGLVPADAFADLAPQQQHLLTASAPLVQERMTLLGEVVGMLGFLFTRRRRARPWPTTRARRCARSRAAVLDAATAVLAGLPEFTTAATQEALQAALVDEGGLAIKPRFAYTPLRVAVTGRRVSPPLFESMEMLGRESTLGPHRGAARHAVTAIEGVLFDIDDTLVALGPRSATRCRSSRAGTFRRSAPSATTSSSRLWRADVNGHYAAYTRGDVGVRRAAHGARERAARRIRRSRCWTTTGFAAWDVVFDGGFRAAWAAHDEVVAVLDDLPEAGDRRRCAVERGDRLPERQARAGGPGRAVPMLVGVDTLGYGKPHPDVFLEACRRLGTEPARTAYVGDELRRRCRRRARRRARGRLGRPTGRRRHAISRRDDRGRGRPDDRLVERADRASSGSEQGRPPRERDVRQVDLVAAGQVGVGGGERVHLGEPALALVGCHREQERATGRQRAQVGRADALGPREAPGLDVARTRGRAAGGATWGGIGSPRCRSSEKAATQGSDSSRSFHSTVRRPPGRSTRAISADAAAGSNQCQAWATVTASTARPAGRSRPPCPAARAPRAATARARPAWRPTARRRRRRARGRRATW